MHSHADGVGQQLEECLSMAREMFAPQELRGELICSISNANYEWAAPRLFSVLCDGATFLLNILLLLFLLL